MKPPFTQSNSASLSLTHGRETILVIDDDESVHDLVGLFLTPLVHEIIHATRPRDGISSAHEHEPDVILLDIMMPEVDGFEVCRRLKESERTRDIPILFLTADTNARHLAKGLDCGGTDYITKPFTALELRARVRAALRTKRLIDMLKRNARLDTLTGLCNRGALDQALATSLSGLERKDQPFGLLLLDLDGFKEINDSHGHRIGDEVLHRLGAIIRAACRPYDVASRYGGDEFVIVLNQSEKHEAESASLRLLDRIRALDLRVGNTQLRLGCSAGLACVSDARTPLTPEELIDAADAALYEAKMSGGNRLMVARCFTACDARGDGEEVLL